jgi:ubiquinone/menaquinone biosynthesis C-methylase UbiE
VNLAHSGEQLEDLTHRQVAELFPHFRRQLRGDERMVLDFGCGPGRFTGPLAEATGGRVIGVDPMRELLDLAPRRPGIEYVLSDGRRIPLADTSIDVVWCCLVLGGLSDAKVVDTVSEFERVLRQGGLIFLVENTAAKPDCPHWRFRPVELYQALIPFAPLTHLHDYDDLGERISVLAGRKKSTSP